MPYILVPHVLFFLLMGHGCGFRQNLNLFEIRLLAACWVKFWSIWGTHGRRQSVSLNWKITRTKIQNQTAVNGTIKIITWSILGRTKMGEDQALRAISQSIRKMTMIRRHNTGWTQSKYLSLWTECPSLILVDFWRFHSIIYEVCKRQDTWSPCPNSPLFHIGEFKWLPMSFQSDQVFPLGFKSPQPRISPFLKRLLFTPMN